MNETLYRIQIQYANAIYQAERWQREAQIAKALLDEVAEAEARSQFIPTTHKEASYAPTPAAKASLRTKLMMGVYSRIANETGTDRSHVRRVVNGDRTSEVVMAAWTRETDRVEKEVIARLQIGRGAR